MKLEKGASVAVVVRREWANLAGVSLFLRQNESPPGKQISGSDNSHIIFATGLWIELNTDKHKENATVERFPLLVPWTYILTIVISEKFAPAIYETANKIGFNPVGQREF